MTQMNALSDMGTEPVMIYLFF